MILNFMFTLKSLHEKGLNIRQDIDTGDFKEIAQIIQRHTNLMLLIMN